MYRSINRPAVYVRASPLQNNASILGDLGALSWLAGMPPLVYTGLKSSTWLNSADVCVRLRRRTLTCAGPLLRQKYKQLRWTPPLASVNGREENPIVYSGFPPQKASDSESVVKSWCHYSDVNMRAMASQITGVSIVCPTVCSGVFQRRHQRSSSLAFVRRIHRWIPITKGQ